ncbi:hypothetical protein G3580_05765 [Nitrogeniibacter mangrovi]|uniref:Pilus assembly protein PilW n=1 Tax=Nitrogeniibacter mangrovi TaxID=2016596 RepID=A0A6C1BBS8_9RHOO|nr:PilW family protein [Nitrogeniibacter mangrovi]QID19734.1 hypothetical protein G3580_05765 [Nitrogeniibacter mangrovi]
MNMPARAFNVRHTRARQYGLSLIELMIGMLIGLILVGGMIALFVSNRQTYRYNEELARLQENSRYAVSTIERTLRMAGHIGCAKLQDIGTGNFTDEWISAPAGDMKNINAIEAQQFGSAYSGIVSDAGYTAVNGSDVITVVYGSGASASMPANAEFDAGATSLVIQNNALGFKNGENVLIASCEAAGIARISNTPGSGNNVTLQFDTSGGNNSRDGFSKVSFADETRIMRLANTTFFIGPSTGRTTNRQGQAFNSLYVAAPGLASNQVSEMVEGVVDMVVSYGVPASTGGSEVSKYENSAALLADIAAGTLKWNDVIAVKVDLLLSSVDDSVISDSQGIVFNGKTYADKRLYTVATTTVALRRTF